MSTDLIAPIKVITNGDMSGNLTGTPVDVMYTDNITIQFVWTGTPVGTFGVSVSNDATLSPFGLVIGGTWTPLVLTAPNPPTPTGAAGNGIINLNGIAARFIQATYTATSGAGTCNATLTGKPI